MLKGKNSTIQGGGSKDNINITQNNFKARIHHTYNINHCKGKSIIEIYSHKIHYTTIIIKKQMKHLELYNNIFKYRIRFVIT
jgi:hypothetical protein